MSKLFDSKLNFTKTENGCDAYESTCSKVLDFFGTGGGMRAATSSDRWETFYAAFAEDKDLSLRVLQYLYDARCGQGERDLFYDIMRCLLNGTFISATTKIKLLKKIPELGRYDMLVRLLSAIDKDSPDACSSINAIFEIIKDALNDKSQCALCAKWLPRQGREANRIRGYLGLTPKLYRHTLSRYKTTETYMSANRWGDIEYRTVPSKCMHNVSEAFTRHDKTRFQEFLDSVKNGSAKIHADAIYPYDIIKGHTYFNSNKFTDTELLQWKSLKDFMGGTKINILPMVDVSGSMQSGVSAKSSLSCLEVALSLGMYVAERNHGAFEDEVLTFTDTPMFKKLEKYNLDKNMHMLMRHVGYNTDLARAFEVLLKKAKSINLKEEDMPQMLLVMSDMQFDEVASDKCITTMDEVIPKLYERAGYKMPILVYWNLFYKQGRGLPTTEFQQGRMLVSGFSPSILEPILSCNFEEVTPKALMLNAIMRDRYAL